MKAICNRDKKESPASGKILRNDLVLLMRYIKDAEEQLGGLEEETLKPLHGVILATRSSVFRFCSLLELVISSRKISPGKSNEEVNSFGN